MQKYKYRAATTKNSDTSNDILDSIPTLSKQILCFSAKHTQNLCQQESLDHEQFEYFQYHRDHWIARKRNALSVAPRRRSDTTNQQTLYAADQSDWEWLCQIASAASQALGY